MDLVREGTLRDELRPFVARNNVVAYAAVMVDFSVFLSATALAIAVDPIWLKVLLSIVAGAMIATLFVLGHDAAHGSLVSSPAMNRILGRLLFLPALHNYTLWRVQHNRLHHQSPNVKGINSWAPLSLDEYRNLPRWRQLVERVYRGGGFGAYYLVERWWKDKFYPSADVDERVRGRAFADLSANLGWLIAFCSGAIAIGAYTDHSWWSSLIWGFLLPYLVWNSSMGLTVYLQHTHPMVPWFRTEAEAERHGGQAELTINVKYPRWYGFLSHEIMEHPAHHINPLIPFYHLHAAQNHLNHFLGDEAVVEHVGLSYVLGLMRRCKLYDYERQEWMDYSGRTTGQTHAAFISPEIPEA
jgi:omega-6 fatty acid desaturase (delta-12 desaturase)